MDIVSKKRERSVNFSCEETEKLVSILEKYKYIIENKKSDSVARQEKTQAWKSIEKRFNTGTRTCRNVKNLKLKYESLKRDIRKKSIIRAECYKTGGDVSKAPILTPAEQKVKKMILLTGDEEGNNQTDQLDDASSEESVEFVRTRSIEAINLELPMSDTDTDGCSNISNFEMNEKPPIKRSYSVQRHYSGSNTSQQGDQDTLQPDTIVSPQNKRSKCKPASLKSPTLPVLDKLRENSPCGKSPEEKSALEKKIIEEQLKEQVLRRQMVKNEMHHKNEMYKLERVQMRLKTDILKIELQQKMKFYDTNK